MKKFKTQNVIVSLLIIISILMIGFSCGSLAKYVYNQTNKYLIEPDKYIFECDKSEDETYVINNLTPSFKLSNYIVDELTSFDITYSVQVIDVNSKEVVFPLTTEDQNAYTNVIMTCDNKEDHLININGLEYGASYQVVITTTSPYVSEYSFYYLVTMESLETYYSVVEYSTWILVNLYIGSELPQDDITIVFGEYLTPNNANELMHDWKQEDGQGVITIDSLTTNSYYQFEFFKYGDLIYEIEKGYIIDNKIIL